MKAIRRLVPVLAILLACAGPPPTEAAPTYTDGSASFTVNLISIPGNYSQRVDAYWVTDESGAFVMTARYDAGTRRGYLTQWAAARGAWPYNAPIDGFSGATISTWGTFTVNWDCRNTNNVLMPDGLYKFWIEMTDYNGSGPYTTNGIPFYKGLTNVNNTYPNQQYIQNIAVTYTPALAYDIAVTRIAPTVAPTNTLVPVAVTVTNKTSVPESFTVTLSNATSGILLGSYDVGTLGGNEVTNVSFTWDTSGLEIGGYAVVARASAVPNETVLADNILTRTVTLRPPTHDVGVAAIAVPATVRPDARTNVTVTVTNSGDAAESFAVVLTDDTDSKVIGTNQVNALAAQASTTTLFPWNTTNATWGVHTLRAAAATVPDETALADNTLSVLTSVLPPPTTNIYIAKSNYWRYHDQGLDLGTAWKEVAYEDSAWPSGRGPLGYGDAPTNTVLSWGPSSTAKYPTYYFRAQFNLTAMPETLTMRLRRDDGAVVYINGVEAYRTNLPTGTISYTTWALAAVGGTDETTYFQTNLPTANLVFGPNLVAVEIHQSAGDSSDVSFDLELLGAVPPAVPTHDVAISLMAVPPQVLPSTTTNVTVVVTNRGSFTESFAVTLTDDTDTVSLGTQNVSSLATNAGASLAFPWTTPAGPWVNHTLRAVAGPVPSEMARTDNTNTAVVFLAPLLETNVLIGRSNWWRYNDGGFDLTLSPWKQLDYIDSTWGWGRGSFGYGDPVTTTNSYGTNANAKYPTYYYRAKCNLDVPPTWMRLRLRRDDGAVVYHNGVEIFRVNVTNNPVSYTHWASATVDGTSETTYFENDVPVTNAVVGTNVIAVELHQVNATSSDLSFDLELLGINPRTSRVHEVAVAEVRPEADALVGDQMRVAVTVTNRGNASETFTVYLRDTVNTQIVGTAVLSNLAVGASSTVMFDWRTVGASAGSHDLQAFTVRGGVTNLAGMASATARLTGTGFGLHAAGAVGSLGGRCAALAPSGNLLVIGAGATLEVWNVANPALPLKLGSVRLPGLIEGITLAGSNAFAACGQAGVQWVDLSQPASPVHANTFDTSGHAYGCAASGNYLYVADGASGLRIVNIATPATPSVVGAYYTEGPARAVAVAGARAYVVDADKGLLVLNVANPALPTLLGSYAGFHAGQAVALSGGTAYVVDANNHLFVVYVANPMSPTLTGSLTLTNLIPQSLAVNGSTVYVAAGASGLAILTAANPAAPALVSVIPTPGEASGVAVAGATLYLADGFAGFQTYNLAAPVAPLLVGDYATALRASEVVVDGGLAYVAGGETGLRIYAVTNPTAPVLVGTFPGAANASGIALSGATAYVADSQYGLKMVNVADPAAPVLLGTYTTLDLGYLRHVAVAGSLVLISDGRQVALLEASDPANPVLRDTYRAPAFAFSLTVSGSHAYLACGNFGVIILSITPAALSPVGTYDTAGFATRVAVSGAIAHVADGPNGWLMLDVSNPAAPAPLGPPAVAGPIAEVAVSGVLASIANGANLAAQVDVTVPLTPVTRKVFSGLVRALRMAAAGEQTFIAEDEAGLAIVDSSADSDHDGLPDAWEQQIVDANPNDAIGTILAVRPGDDYDGDGASNQAELLAGTSPTDPASVFLLRITSPDGARATIQWHSVAGKTYTLYKTSNLGAGFSVLQDNLAATPPLNTFTDPAPGPDAFYLISVR